AFGVFYIRIRRGEDLIAGRDLFGVDERFAIETELFALLAGVAESVGVVQIHVHTVQNRDAVGACGQEALTEGGEQGQAHGRVRAVQLFGQVVGAHDKTAEPWRGASDLIGVEDAAWGLDHTPDFEILGGAVGFEDRLDLQHHVGGIDFGDENSVDLGLRRGDNVVVSPRRGEAVGAQEQLAFAVATLVGGIEYVLACFVFGVGRYSVF